MLMTVGELKEALEGYDDNLPLSIKVNDEEYIAVNIDHDKKGYDDMLEGIIIHAEMWD